MVKYVIHFQHEVKQYMRSLVESQVNPEVLLQVLLKILEVCWNSYWRTRTFTYMATHSIPKHATEDIHDRVTCVEHSRMSWIVLGSTAWNMYISNPVWGLIPYQLICFPLHLLSLVLALHSETLYSDRLWAPRGHNWSIYLSTYTLPTQPTALYSTVR